ncbi:hypothetical protein MSG28_002250 [Choristoneura fumiferana]|uniref:Uncharacterized protein n=1 Tax=Choristoneura fumiferana TaxID=7141 RepID=A0ACC0JUU5_CHOFU|nr:hypothetical protein MSG28_002250 [Choristoneura fumiferana]
MQVPFQHSFHNQGIQPPNNCQWRLNFMPRGPYLRAPRQNWRPPPQEFSNENEYWCETCDRGFRTADILEKHKQQHQKCNIDGCQFIAHPKVITKHIQMQHASGLYKKIAKLQDPEEIKKWREERKKKYPTKENVEKAVAAMKEKIERGEKMGLKIFRHERNHKTDTANKRKSFDNQRNHTPRFNQNASKKRRKVIPKPNEKKLPAVEDTRKLKPFGGIQELNLNVDEEQEDLKCDFRIEDEDDVPEATTSVKDTVVASSVCLALSSLQCDYGSSDDEEECEKDKNTEPGQKTEKHTTSIIKDTTPYLIPPKKHESDDDSGPEEVNVIKKINDEPNNLESKPTNKRKSKDDILKRPIFKRPKPKLPSTLLHKLLFKEVRHERNIVLQCVRHIVKNNFFDKTN